MATAEEGNSLLGYSDTWKVGVLSRVWVQVPVVALVSLARYFTIICFVLRMAECTMIVCSRNGNQHAYR